MDVLLRGGPFDGQTTAVGETGAATIRVPDDEGQVYVRTGGIESDDSGQRRPVFRHNPFAGVNGAAHPFHQDSVSA